MQQELSNHKCAKNRLAVWQRGVDTDQFNPRYRCKEMRSRLTSGHPDAPILIHVGRLGAEKNLFVLKDMLDQIPGAHLAFVGDGPSRQELQQHFKGMPNVKFMVHPSFATFLCESHSFRWLYYAPSHLPTPLKHMWQIRWKYAFFGRAKLHHFDAAVLS
jgi:glycosyltransferase involved in cell wall biosynthesis